MSEQNRQVFLKRKHKIFKIIEYNRKNNSALYILTVYLKIKFFLYLLFHIYM